MAHVYFHIDLNAFFANAEILLDSSLKGKPVAVSRQTRRSVVSTASYEARAKGVHSAMPIQEAKCLCPDLVVVEPHFNWYRTLSEDFMRIVESYTDQVERASIDECYADMTQAITAFEKPLDLAWTLQGRIMKELHLPCSIGIGPNMFLAKMGSDMKKPLGITVLRIREVPQKLWPLKIGDMRGIGSRTLPYMEALGIHTIGDLAHYEDQEALRRIFGKNTNVILQRAHGYDDRMPVLESDPKSMGISETMLEDITDYDEIRGLFRTLCKRLSKRLFMEKKAGTVLSIRIRYFDFSNADRSETLAEPIWKADDLFVYAMRLFEENWEGEPVRLIGLSVTGFAMEDTIGRQINFFHMEEPPELKTTAILKELNHQLSFGGKLVRASSLLKEKRESGYEN